MIDERRDQRREQIEAAAYAILSERGYAGMSMLAVARAAAASNETLYRWYGDKAGLVSAMIARNSQAVLQEIAGVAEADQSLEAGLESVGMALLGMLTGTRAVVLNRAAVADASGVLSQALVAGGRDLVAPRIGDLMTRHGIAADAGAELFLRLLLGDWQIRRVLGAMPEPDAAQIRARVGHSVRSFLALRQAGLVNDL